MMEAQIKPNAKVKAFINDCAAVIKVHVQESCCYWRADRRENHRNTTNLPAPRPRAMNTIREGVKESSPQNVQRCSCHS